MIQLQSDRLGLALSRHLGLRAETFEAAMRLEEDLGLDPLDLVLVALRLEEEEQSEFPLGGLESIRTVADFTELVEEWLADSAPPCAPESCMRVHPDSACTCAEGEPTVH